jgi:prophage regulatory protein
MVIDNEHKTKEPAPPPGRVVINRKQLRQKVPLSERTILDMEKRGAFPRRFSISPRLVVWDNAEVDAWIAGQQAAAIQQPPPGATAPRR